MPGSNKVRMKLERTGVYQERTGTSPLPKYRRMQPEGLGVGSTGDRKGATMTHSSWEKAKAVAFDRYISHF